MTVTPTLTAASSSASADSSPPARRARRPGWRDPRLSLGLVLMALSVVIGVRVVDGSRELTAVLAASRPLVAGQAVTSADLTTVEVRFARGADADRYLAADSDVAGAVLSRPVAAGELLPRAATTATTPAQARVPLAVQLGRVPGTVTVGSVVDVWAVRESASRRVWRAVPVVAMDRSHGLGPESEIRVVVGVPDGGRAVKDAVGDLTGSGLVLVHRPDGS